MNIQMPLYFLLLVPSLACSPQLEQKSIKSDSKAKIAVNLVEVNMAQIETQFDSESISSNNQYSAEIGDKQDTPEEENPKVDKNKPKSDDTDECSAKVNIQKDRIKVAGSLGIKQFTVEDALAVKITGNKNQVTLVAKGADEIKAVCIFIAGNINNLKLNVEGKIGTLYYKARGNQSNGVISVVEKGEIGAMSFDLAGNQAKVEVSGAGKFNCDDLKKKIHGNDSDIQCSNQ